MGWVSEGVIKFNGLSEDSRQDIEVLIVQLTYGVSVYDNGIGLHQAISLPYNRNKELHHIAKPELDQN